MGHLNMAEVLRESDLRTWIESFANVVLRERDRLDELDSAIGDGEHGSNLAQGMSAVLTLLRDSEFTDLREMFDAIGMTIVNSVGGASGALYGTLFLRFSDAGDGRQELDLGILTAAFASGMAGMMELGRTKAGDKTMLDAIHPAVEALSSARDGSLALALERAAQAATQGRDATAAMLARRGRGSYLGDRSLGHVDAGATSMAALFQALSDTVLQSPTPSSGQPDSSTAVVDPARAT
jgi:dihydroxyacetone kinase-like protein